MGCIIGMLPFELSICVIAMTGLDDSDNKICAIEYPIVGGCEQRLVMVSRAQTAFRRGALGAVTWKYELTS